MSPFQGVVHQHGDNIALFDPVADLDPEFADGAVDAGGDDAGLAGDEASEDGKSLAQGFGNDGVDADLGRRL